MSLYSEHFSGVVSSVASGGFCQYELKVERQRLIIIFTNTCIYPNHKICVTNNAVQLVKEACAKYMNIYRNLDANLKISMIRRINCLHAKDPAPIVAKPQAVTLLAV